jgi:hypothetical protein
LPFATLFSKVASKLFAAAPAGSTGAVEPVLVQMEGEDIVDAVEPRLRLRTNYGRILWILKCNSPRAPQTPIAHHTSPRQRV